MCWIFSINSLSFFVDGLHALKQYSTCGLTSVLYKLIIILGSLFIIVLLIMPKTLLALLQAYKHYCEHFKSQLIIIPKYFSWSTSSYIFPLIYYDFLGSVLPTCITLHLPTLKSICHLSAQSIIASKSFCNLLLSILSLMHLNILVSSASLNIWPCTFSSKSFINIKNSNGPSTDPCGTPLHTSPQLHHFPFIHTLCFLLLHQSLMVHRWGTLPKALARSILHQHYAKSCIKQQEIGQTRASLSKSMS